MRDSPYITLFFDFPGASIIFKRLTPIGQKKRPISQEAALKSTTFILAVITVLSAFQYSNAQINGSYTPDRISEDFAAVHTTDKPSERGCERITYACDPAYVWIVPHPGGHKYYLQQFTPDRPETVKTIYVALYNAVGYPTTADQVRFFVCTMNGNVPDTADIVFDSTLTHNELVFYPNYITIDVSNRNLIFSDDYFVGITLPAGATGQLAAISDEGDCPPGQGWTNYSGSWYLFGDIYAVGYINLLIDVEVCYGGPVWYVSSDGSDESGDGSEANPFRTIQKGIDLAISGDTIKVGPGSYVGNIYFNSKALSIISTNGPESTVIEPHYSGNPTVSIVNCTGITRLEGFSITNGGGVSNHGNILISSNTDTTYIVNNRIYDNALGAVVNNPIIRSASISYITGNLFYDNGGINCIWATGPSDIINNTMDSNNRGIYTTGGEVTALNNIISNSTEYGIAGNFALRDYNNLWNNGSANDPGPNGISADPLYTDPTTHEYTLQDDSPCIDAGHPDPLYDDPDGTRNDIGAFYHIQENDPPILDPIGTRSVDENTLLEFSVFASDPDNTTPLLYTGVLPYLASFTDNGDSTGLFSWTPGFDQAGIYLVTFYATDLFDTVSEHVRITVNNVNRPPVLNEIGGQTAVEGDTLTLEITAFDADGTIPSIVAENIPDGATFSDSGDGSAVFEWNIPYNQLGDYEMLFIASDGALDDSETVIITVISIYPEIPYVAVDGSENNQNVVDHSPFIEWGYSDAGYSLQYQYEIEVGTDDDWTAAEMWDVPPTVSHLNSATYDGGPLRDGDSYYLRVRVNNGAVWSDWYETAFRMNSVPSIPVPIGPRNDIVVLTATPGLMINRADDLEDDDVTYDFLWVNDPSFGPSDTALISDISNTLVQINNPLNDNWRYFWAVRSYDGFEYSDWSNGESFWVNSILQAPGAFEAILPPDTSHALIYDMLPTFIWGKSTDPDPRDSIHYTLIIATDSHFSLANEIDSLRKFEYTLTDSLEFGQEYWWKVRANDAYGLATESDNVRTFRTWRLGDVNADWTLDILDIIYLIEYKFKEGPAPVPLFTGDINGDCTVDILDIIYLINHKFKGGPEPRVGCDPE